MKRQGYSISLFSTIFVTFLLVMSAGCRTSKYSVDQYSPLISTMTIDERLHEVANANRPWSQLNLPVKVSLKSPDKMSLSGRIYMRRNNDIYVTLRVLGMEVANLYVNSDSIFVADKSHKYYFAEPIDNLFTDASLTIGDIQDILLGRAFINNCGTLTEQLISQVTPSDADADSWLITPHSKINGTIGYSFRFADGNNAMQSFTVDTTDKQYSCTYSDPAIIDGSRFMQRIAIVATAGKIDIDASLSFDFDKVKWEVPESARWRHPKNYKRVDPRAISQALSEEENPE